MFFINHTDTAEGKAAIVEIDGPLNSETSSDFENYIKKLADNGIIFLLFDMKKISFISSEGIGAALLIHRRIKERNGIAVFYNLNTEVSALFGILGFSRIFTILQKRSDALAFIEEKIKQDETPARDISQVRDTNESREEHRPPHIPEPELFEFEERPASEPLQNFSDETVEPFIIECLKCGSLVRINEKGDHICPFCQVEFTVSDDGKAVFRIDEVI